MNDIPSMLEFGREMFLKSNMAPLGWNRVIARRTMKAAITDTCQCAFIALDEGKVVGGIIGNMYVMPFSSALCATDVAFVAKKGGRSLIRKFISWCKSKNVKRIDMGVSQEHGKPDPIYVRHGFERSGGLFYMNVEAP